MTNSGYQPYPVPVKEPTPRGLFSRLIWRFLRYDRLEPAKIYLFFAPPTGSREELRAAWIEWPAGDTFKAGVGLSGATVGFTDDQEALT